MPRAKAPLKRDLLRQDLANALGVNVADILTRTEVVSEYGKELGYTNEKSLSNAGNTAPCFYLAPLFGPRRAADKGIGLALYWRRDLWLWINDKGVGGARWKMENLKEKGRPYPWPTVTSSSPTPPQPAKSDAEVGLDSLTDDEDYKAKVLGRRRWS